MFIQHTAISMLSGTVVGCVAVCEVLCIKGLTEVLRCPNVIIIILLR